MSISHCCCLAYSGKAHAVWNTCDDCTHPLEEHYPEVSTDDDGVILDLGESRPCGAVVNACGCQVLVMPANADLNTCENCGHEAALHYAKRKSGQPRRDVPCRHVLSTPSPAPQEQRFTPEELEAFAKDTPTPLRPGQHYQSNDVGAETERTIKGPHSYILVSPPSNRGGGKWYQQGGIEPVDFILSNNLPGWKAIVIEYVFRAGVKEGSSEEYDIEKAMWWLTQRMAQLKLNRSKKS